MHTALAGSIGRDDAFLLVAQLVQLLLIVLKVFLLVLWQLLVVLLEVAQGIDHVLRGIDVLVNGLELGIQGFLGQIDDLLDERVLGVEHQAVHVRHLAIEAHAGLESCHLLHAAHVFGLGDDHRLVVGRHGGKADHELSFLDGRYLGVEQRLGHFLLLGRELRLVVILLADEVVEHVAVDAHKAHLFLLLFQHPHKGHVELAVHQQHVIALVGSRLDVGILCLLVGSIQADEVALLVGLLALDELAVVLNLEVLAVAVLEQGELEARLTELLVAQHAVLDEDLDVVPLLLELVGLVLGDFLEAGSHLLGDVVRNLFYRTVALQVAA